MANPETLRLELPYPPSVNMLWRAVPRRGMILSKMGRIYRDEALAALRKQVGGRRPFTGRLEVLLEVFPPDRRRRDLSNVPKAVEDAITKALNIWVDDEQIDDLRIVRRQVENPPKVVIHIRELPKKYKPGCDTLGW
jgi:crossover junction endodeoxyribonuclease RusA